MKYATLGEPEQEEGTGLSRVASPKPGPSHAIPQPVYSTEPCSHVSAEAKGKAVQQLPPQIAPPLQSLSPSRLQGHQSFSRGTLSQLLPVTTDVLSTQILPRTLLDSQRVPPPIQIHPAQFHLAEQFSHIPSLIPLQFAPRSRQTSEVPLYLPFPPRLAAHVSSVPITESRPASTSVSSVLAHHSLVSISYQHPRPVIATCLTQFSPVVSLVVPVRHQTHRPTYAGAVYTTLSQILASTHSQEPIRCPGMVIMSSIAQSKQQQTYLKVPSPDTRSLLPLTLPTELASGSGEGYGPLGAGGSKRMLSPAASLELSTEAQRHQKRVKEEEEGEHTSREKEEDAQKALPEEGESKPTWEKLEGGEEEQPQRGESTVKVEEVQERVPRKDAAEEKEGRKSTEKTNKKDKVPVVQQQIGRANAPTYPSLHTSTTVNWCYLNYVKPNPSALRDPVSSVYSTWSISAHNPNLPGLSTKVALSLLCSKQKHSSETYTMATAPTPAKTEATPESSSTQKVAEVNIGAINADRLAVLNGVPCRDDIFEEFISGCLQMCLQVYTTPPSPVTKVKGQQQPEEESKETKEEEGPSTSKQSDASCLRIFEGG